MDEFKLTGEQWGIVASEMKTFGHLATDKDRVEIESTCDRFIQQRIVSGKSLPKPGQQAKQWQAVHDAAEKLLKAVKSDPDVSRQISLLLRLPGEASSSFMRLLDVLPGVANRMAEIASTRPRAPSASDPELDDLQKRLISFWSGSGGTVSSSTSQEGTTPGGPLIRFLEATYSPALVAAGMGRPSADALRKIIRKLKAAMEDELIESLFQVAAGEPFTTRKMLADIDHLRKAGRLTVETIPLNGTVACRAKWPGWWVVNDSGYWPAALDYWLNSMKITDAAGLDVWLKRKVKPGGRILLEKTSANADQVWKIINPVWPLHMMQPSA